MRIYLLATDRQRTPMGGMVFHPRTCSAYGALFSTAGPVIAFCGEPREGWGDRYHLGNGYRRYNPALMRFQEPDALSPFGAGGINGYMYCAGDPVNRRDSTGRVWTVVQLAATATLHTLSPVAMMISPPPKGPLAKAANRVAIVGSLTTGISAIVGGVQGAAVPYVPLAGTALLLGGVSVRIGKALWDNRETLGKSLGSNVKANAQALVGLSNKKQLPGGIDLEAGPASPPVQSVSHGASTVRNSTIESRPEAGTQAPSLKS